MNHRARTVIVLLAVVDLDAATHTATDPATTDPEPATLRSPGPPASHAGSPSTLRDLFGLSGEGVRRGV